MEENNFIHPTAIVEDGCKLGSGNYIGPYCYLSSKCVIGNNNRFEGYCSIGTPAEHREYFHKKVGSVVIKDDNVFREFVTVNTGTVRKTVINSNCIFLRGSHVGHDSFIEDKVTLSCNVLIGGHSYVMEGCNFGLGSVCHQYSVIGAYSMIGMGAVITKKTDVDCGKVYVGNPAKLLKENEHGLIKNSVSEQYLKDQKIRRVNIVYEWF